MAEVYKTKRGKTVTITVSRTQMVENLIEQVRQVVRDSNAATRQGTLRYALAQLRVKLESLDAFDKGQGWEDASGDFEGPAGGEMNHG